MKKINTNISDNCIQYIKEELKTNQYNSCSTEDYWSDSKKKSYFLAMRKYMDYVNSCKEPKKTNKFIRFLNYITKAIR